MTTTTLKEYRLWHPGSAAVPTISQSGGLGAVLERIERKAELRLLRRERLQRVRRWVAGLGVVFGRVVSTDRTAGSLRGRGNLNRTGIRA